MVDHPNLIRLKDIYEDENNLHLVSNANHILRATAVEASMETSDRGRQG